MKTNNNRQLFVNRFVICWSGRGLYTANRPTLIQPFSLFVHVGVVLSSILEIYLDINTSMAHNIQIVGWGKGWHIPWSQYSNP